MIFICILVALLVIAAWNSNIEEEVGVLGGKTIWADSASRRKEIQNNKDNPALLYREKINEEKS